MIARRFPLLGILTFFRVTTAVGNSKGPVSSTLAASGRFLETLLSSSPVLAFLFVASDVFVGGAPIGEFSFDDVRPLLVSPHLQDSNLKLQLELASLPQSHLLQEGCPLQFSFSFLEAFSEDF